MHSDRPAAHAHMPTALGSTHGELSSAEPSYRPPSHPREVMQKLALDEGLKQDDPPIQLSVVERACDQLAGEYRRFLTVQDYQALAQIDHSEVHACSDERINDLLYNLALFEYNDGSWRRSNPVIRRLPAYQDEVNKIPPK